MKRMMTLIGIILGLLLTYYIIVSIAFLSFDGIVQGDFIGFGGDDTFCPNTITYIFDEVIDQNIIIAPHTLYATDGELKDAYTINDMVDMEIFDDTEYL